MQAVSSASCGVPGGQPGAQDGVLLAAAGGGVDREAEGAGGAAVAQPAQRDLLAAGQDGADAGEGTAASDLHGLHLRPVLCGVVQQPPGDRVAGRFRDGGHVPHCAARRSGRWL